MEQNNWINEVLESTKGMQKAEASPFLFEKISNRIQTGKTASPVKTNNIKWVFVLVAAVILIVNIIAISNYSNSENKNSNETELVSALGSELGYNSNYNY
ncbi:MAG TPA: hypothetical protein VN026_15050 [Bacteroidia bacterium]|jgi:hypothetical protein|nr:hypothetical protein [Bacteroidia bacterium]